MGHSTQGRIEEQVKEGERVYVTSGTGHGSI